MTASDTSNEHKRGALAPLTDAMRDVRAAGDRLRDAQKAAWRAYLDEVDEAIAGDLGTPEETGGDEGTDPVQALLDAVRGRIDDIRVQVRLGMMEGEDVAHEIGTVLSDVVDRLRAPLR
jgi:hypothetical protein